MIKNIKKFFGFILLLLFFEITFGQNNFSQFYSNPLMVNPSNTGRFLGDYRLGGIYRNQSEISSFSSKYSFYTDMSILSSSLPEFDKIAFGILGFGEKNDFNGIKNSNLLFSGTYFKNLNNEGTERLGAGFQIDFAHKKISPPILVFPDQIIEWSNSGFSGINPFQYKLIQVKYVDFNVGLNYQKLINRKDLLFFGVSVAHANSPSKNDGDVVFSLLPQVSFQFEFEKQLRNKNKLLCAIITNDITSKKVFNDYYISLIYQTIINESRYKMNIGSLYKRSYQFGSSIIPVFGFKYGNINLNLSYDISFGEKKFYNKKSGMEIGMIIISKKRSTSR